MDPLKDELIAALRRENAALTRENAALTTELTSLRSGGLVASVTRALQLERERQAAAASAAQYHSDQRSLWLRSADCLQRVLTLVAFSGHSAWSFSSLCRSYRGDAQLWGCIKNRRTSKGRTSLMASCRTGDLARVRWLIGLGADVHALAEDGDTALVFGCKAGHLGIVQELLGHGVSVQCKNSVSRVTLLEEACSLGHLDILRALLVRDFTEADMGLGLVSAGIYCRRSIVRKLLGRGVPVDFFRLGGGKTAMMYACKFGGIETVRILLAHGASKTARDSDGKTAFMHVPAANEELKDLVRE